MTVRGNMAFSLKLRKADSATITNRVNQAAEILGLMSDLDRYPRQLSGGQRQRVATGRAIVRDPQVFLFDEPLSNLDAKQRVQMRVEIKGLHQRLRTTSVYVTHDQVEAMTMADRIVVMHDGRVEQIGTPLDLYDHPANLFVAGFIGSPAMNFIKGTLRRSGDDVWVEAAGNIRLPAERNAAGHDGQSVVYGIRPEHLGVPPTAAPPFQPRSPSSSRPAPTPTSMPRSPMPRSAPCSTSATTSRPVRPSSSSRGCRSCICLTRQAATN
jgi:multiple sugar transport system ATP-binding protein